MATASPRRVRGTCGYSGRPAGPRDPVLRRGPQRCAPARGPSPSSHRKGLPGRRPAPLTCGKGASRPEWRLRCCRRAEVSAEPPPGPPGSRPPTAGLALAGRPQPDAEVPSCGPRAEAPRGGASKTPSSTLARRSVLVLPPQAPCRHGARAADAVAVGPPPAGAGAGCRPGRKLRFVSSEAPSPVLASQAMPGLQLPRWTAIQLSGCRGPEGGAAALHHQQLGDRAGFCFQT